MQLLQKLLNKFNGLHYRQEYLCTGLESFEHPLHVYLVDNGKVIKDITKQHCFVGYCPLVFALPASVSDKENIHLIFTPILCHNNDAFQKKEIVASLILKKIERKEIEETLVSFYEGSQGKHRFISSFHQYIIGLNNNLFAKKPGNVFLQGNLYHQVQIAYSIPRKICLITVGENNLYNLFPTDLHGQISNDYYVISLRHEGKACQQVEKAKRVVLSDMPLGSYKKIYSLGKNHMQPLKDRSSFDFSASYSCNWQLPLPECVISYKELELQSTIIYGIHKLLLFRIIHGEQVAAGSDTLVHIHNSYATWRNNQGISGNYLLR